MLSNILTLIRKDFIIFMRNPIGVIMTFVVPFAVIWIIGSVFALNNPDRGPGQIPLGLAVADDATARAVADALRKEPGFRIIDRHEVNGVQQVFDETSLRAMVENGQANFAVFVPRTATEEGAFGLQLKLFSNPRNEVEAQMVNGLIQRAVFANMEGGMMGLLRIRAVDAVGASKWNEFNMNVAKSVAQTFGGDVTEISRSLERGEMFPSSPSPEESAASKDPASPSGISNMLQIKEEQVVGKDVKSPAATRVVSGFAVQFLLFSLSASGTALLYERDMGLYHRLLASPLKRAHILWAKFIFMCLVGIFQLCVLFCASQLLFGTDVLSHFPLLLLTAAFAAAACTSFGMLLASLSRTPEAAHGMATLLILTMSAVGGAWFPLSLMPEFMQHVARFTLVFWAMDGFDTVLWRQSGLISLLPTLGILSAITLGVMGIAVWRFQRSRLFA